MDVSVIIVAAGQSRRMGGGVDKLLLPMGGRPLIAWTWAIFERMEEVHEIVLVIRPEMEPEYEKLRQAHGFTKEVRFAHGGKERQDSVWNGLAAVSVGCGIVAVHDGARAMTDRGEIVATIAAAREFGAAVLAQRVTDTVKASDDGVSISKHLDRSLLWSVQTPQTFRVEVLRRALEEVRRTGVAVTDDTAACELIGQSVRLVESVKPNPKATHPSDLVLLEGLLGEW